MGTKYSTLVAYLFLFCYESNIMFALSDNKQTDVIKVFNFTSKYLDYLLNVDNFV